MCLCISPDVHSIFLLLLDIYKCASPPPTVANGDWIGNTTFVTIECFPSYSVISGDEVLTCPKERWEGIVPVCEKSLYSKINIAVVVAFVQVFLNLHFTILFKMKLFTVTASGSYSIWNQISFLTRTSSYLVSRLTLVHRVF